MAGVNLELLGDAVRGIGVLAERGRIGWDKTTGTVRSVGAKLKPPLPSKERLKFDNVPILSNCGCPRPWKDKDSKKSAEIPEQYFAKEEARKEAASAVRQVESPPAVAQPVERAPAVAQLSESAPAVVQPVESKPAVAKPEEHRPSPETGAPSPEASQKEALAAAELVLKEFLQKLPPEERPPELAPFMRSEEGEAGSGASRPTYAHGSRGPACLAHFLASVSARAQTRSGASSC